ncbi:MAG: hypothetical protein LBI17_02915 [Rickettsiales bacterium]|jgi:hypothetical protein|nr:hypothetical protein [Rickettsiales bacterium]
MINLAEIEKEMRAQKGFKENRVYLELPPKGIRAHTRIEDYAVLAVRRPCNSDPAACTACLSKKNKEFCDSGEYIEKNNKTGLTTYNKENPDGSWVNIVWDKEGRLMWMHSFGDKDNIELRNDIFPNYYWKKEENIVRVDRGYDIYKRGYGDKFYMEVKDSRCELHPFAVKIFEQRYGLVKQ